MKKAVLFFIAVLPLSVLAQYFQQRVDYQIDVRLYPEQKKIKSYEKIVYHNNSPDTLNFIYFHLWLNAYSNRNTPLAKQLASIGKTQLHFKFKEYKGWIDSLDFKIDGQPAKIVFVDKYKEIAKIILPKPLPPNDSVVITTPFVAQIPKLSSRCGWTEKDFEISQWYPKPAVYDKYGWHYFPYLNQGEFYSEFGSFDVKITVPSTYIVAATGNLIQKTDTNGLSTYHFYENNIHDFVWTASEDYFVSEDSVFLESGRVVKIYAYYFKDDIDQWQNALTYVENAIGFYSNLVGEYPYKTCKVVQGYLKAGGGMEYPTLAIISSFSEEVIVHEVGHNWFYGILGFNEREYPFLDEGINSYYDHRYSPKSWFLGSRYSYYYSNVLSFLGLNQPLDLHSTQYPFFAYPIVVYENTAFDLRYLEKYLGTAEFDSIMQLFYQQWKFKHPYPEDFENHFKKYASKDVSWFFDYVVKTNLVFDYKIKVRKQKAIIKKKFGFYAPVKIVAFDQNRESVYGEWILPKTKKTEIKLPESAKYVIIDPFNFTFDFNRYNNFSKTKGIFKKIKNFKVSLFRQSDILQNPEGTKVLYITPLAYLTDYQLNIGLGITQHSFPFKNVYFKAVPLFNITQKKFFGAFKIQFHKIGGLGFPKRTFIFGFDRYPVFSSDSTFYFPKPLRKLYLGYKYVIQNPQATDKFYKILSLQLTLNIPERLPIFSIYFIGLKKTAFRPVRYRLQANWWLDNYQIWADLTYKIHYFNILNGIKFRFFAGSNVSPTGLIYKDDIKFNAFFVNPLIEPQNMYSGNFWKHQFLNEFGGIVSLYPSEYYHYVFALNTSASVPPVGFLKVFFNVAYFGNLIDGKGLKIFDFQQPMWETGIQISLLGDQIAFYLPIFASKQLMDYNNNLSPSLISHFRFVLSLNRLQNFGNF